jgi:hypothetical protein
LAGLPGRNTPKPAASGFLLIEAQVHRAKFAGGRKVLFVMSR